MKLLLVARLFVDDPFRIDDDHWILIDGIRLPIVGLRLLVVAFAFLVRSPHADYLMVRPILFE